MTTKTYTMRNLNSTVGERVIINAAPAGMRWAKEYRVTPWDALQGMPLNDDIPAGEYLITGKTPASPAEGCAHTYTLQAL
jgi:hypothetical protein